MRVIVLKFLCYNCFFCYTGSFSISLINQTVLIRSLNIFSDSKCNDDFPFPREYEVSKEKAKTLGICFTPLEVSVKDTIESFKEKGFLNV